MGPLNWFILVQYAVEGRGGRWVSLGAIRFHFFSLRRFFRVSDLRSLRDCCHG